MMDTTVVMVNALEEPLSASSTRAAVVGSRACKVSGLLSKTPSIADCT